MSASHHQLAQPYDDLLPVPALLDWTRDALAPYGFHEHTSLPLVSVCRDELMFEFVDAVTAHWGHCFDLSSLAGLPLMGRTGLAAALGHAPDDDGRRTAPMPPSAPMCGNANTTSRWRPSSSGAWPSAAARPVRPMSGSPARLDRSKQ